MTSPLPGPVRYAWSDGLQIAYQVVGDGPIDMVYVPGLANHMEALWDIPELARFTRRLASFSRLIILDKRGAGLSDRLPEDRRATIEERIHDVLAVLEAASSSRAVVFATADGTPVALTAAATYPDRVQALVLWEASARLLAADDYAIGFPPETRDVVRDTIRAEWGDEQGSILASLAPSVADDPRWQSGMARIERRSCTPSQAARYWALNMELDVRSVLPMISAPTLVLHCRGDVLYPVTHGRYVADAIAGATFAELDGSDHFGFAENGDLVADRIEEFVTGRRADRSDRRRLATLLMTDVVGSTKQVVAVGDDRWRALLDAHDRVLVDEIERHRGRLIDTAGDGCLAVFDGPRDALLAADSIQAEGDRLGLKIRAGIHTGEIEPRGAGVAGIAVHIAARVSAMADAGEILTTRTVRDLVAGSEIRFVDRGAHVLKGVPDEWQVFAASIG
jgi:class 3 adenylate cyclase